MKKLLILLVLTGCASTGSHEPDWCKASGGVWYKGSLDAEYRCVDKESLQDELRRLQERWF